MVKIDLVQAPARPLRLAPLGERQSRYIRAPEACAKPAKSALRYPICGMTSIVRSVVVKRVFRGFIARCHAGTGRFCWACKGCRFLFLARQYSSFTLYGFQTTGILVHRKMAREAPNHRSLRILMRSGSVSKDCETRRAVCSRLIGYAIRIGINI
jgi:transposase